MFVWVYVCLYLFIKKIIPIRLFYTDFDYINIPINCKACVRFKCTCILELFKLNHPTKLPVKRISITGIAGRPFMSICMYLSHTTPLSLSFLDFRSFSLSPFRRVNIVFLVVRLSNAPIERRVCTMRVMLNYQKSVTRFIIDTIIKRTWKVWMAPVKGRCSTVMHDICNEDNNSR